MSDQQKAILFQRGTEAPFRGQFVNHFADGTYGCANCGAQLFTAAAKFASDCGWPSFDQAIDGAVQATTDTSHGMVRTEISCRHCGGHLGHVFDDGPVATTGKRYCINSLSLDFRQAAPTDKQKENL